MRTTKLSTLVTLGALLVGGSAMAQDNSVVTAPRMMHEQTGKALNGLPIERLAISYEVGYSDLNLARKSLSCSLLLDCWDIWPGSKATLLALS